MPAQVGAGGGPHLFTMDVRNVRLVYHLPNNIRILVLGDVHIREVVAAVSIRNTLGVAIALNVVILIEGLKLTSAVR